MKDEYFSAGDMGYRDEDGYYVLVDRKANMIISGGENIFPSEVENVIAGFVIFLFIISIALSQKHSAENQISIDTMNQITTLLRQRHKNIGDKQDDFTVRNLTSIMEMATATTGMITLLLGSIAAISLLVGGIGIMNIMMVSVTERTREIGIRKALGATYQDIMLQFLLESIMIGVLGGTVGIVLGVAAAFAISALGSLNTVISPLPIIVSFGFSVAVGLFFGIYPARKAALLDPIEALRYE